jgi:hypothetical protein
VQLHDVCDEEVEEYFRQKLQLPTFVSLENDELLFWKKLGYHLYTNDVDPEDVMPVEEKEKEKPVKAEPAYYSTKYYNAKPNDDIDFDRYNINRPIIHLHGKEDPMARDKAKVSYLPPLSKPKSLKPLEYDEKELEKINKKKRKKEKQLLKEVDNDSFKGISRLTTPMDEYNQQETRNGYNMENETRVRLNYDENLGNGGQKITDKHYDHKNKIFYTSTSSTKVEEHRARRNSGNLQIQMGDSSANAGRRTINSIPPEYDAVVNGARPRKNSVGNRDIVNESPQRRNSSHQIMSPDTYMFNVNSNLVKNSAHENRRNSNSSNADAFMATNVNEVGRSSKQMSKSKIRYEDSSNESFT